MKIEEEVMRNIHEELKRLPGLRFGAVILLTPTNMGIALSGLSEQSDLADITMKIHKGMVKTLADEGGRAREAIAVLDVASRAALCDPQGDMCPCPNCTARRAAAAKTAPRHNRTDIN